MFRKGSGFETVTCGVRDRFPPYCVDNFDKLLNFFNLDNFSMFGNFFIILTIVC